MIETESSHLYPHVEVSHEQASKQAEYADVQVSHTCAFLDLQIQIIVLLRGNTMTSE